jgi:hypothetical protein
MKRPDLGRRHDLSRVENIVRIDARVSRAAFRASTHKSGVKRGECQNL